MSSIDNKSCSKCGMTSYGSWTSTSTGKAHLYCKPCRDSRRETYNARKIKNGGSHTKNEWLYKLATFDACPRCFRKWDNIPSRPDKRYKYRWIKDHIKPLFLGGTDDIDNIQPLCYQCNFQKNTSYIVA